MAWARRGRGRRRRRRRGHREKEKEKEKEEDEGEREEGKREGGGGGGGEEKEEEGESRRSRGARAHSRTAATNRVYFNLPQCRSVRLRESVQTCLDRLHLKLPSNELYFLLLRIDDGYPETWR